MRTLESAPISMAGGTKVEVIETNQLALVF